MTGLRLLAGSLVAVAAWAHSVPSVSPTPPLRVDGRRLLDAGQREFLLQGAQVSSPAQMTTQTFRVMRQRWNLNSVRLPVSPAVWRRDGRDYLDLMSAAVRRANDEGLVAVLVPADDPELPAFWTAWATAFKDTGLVVFDLNARPRTDNWPAWRASLQTLVDRIRATGARQLIAAAAPVDFMGFAPEHYLSDPNVLYEFHAYLDRAANDEQRDARFGFLGAKFPLYAGEWGFPFGEDSPACRAIPADRAADAVSQLLVYLFFKGISWTAVAFEPGSLVTGGDNYPATELSRPWSCLPGATPVQGMGSILLLWLTGDPLGFGSLAADQIANAAGGPAGPISPGEVITLYGQGVGPENAMSGRIDETGRLATALGGVEVRFEGVAAPLFAGDYYQVKVQAPWEIAGRAQIRVQAFNRGVPSNEVIIPVVDAAPALFTASESLIEVLAINENGTLNSSTRPAPEGSVVALFATGVGVFSPAQETGRPAPTAAPTVLPVTVSIGGAASEILFAGSAPGLIGVAQINVRVPAPFSAQSVPVILTVGGKRAPVVVRLWVNSR